MSAVLFLLSARAFQLDIPGRLQIYNYLLPVIQLVFDFFILHTTFQDTQIIGICVIFCANGIQVYEQINTMKKLNNSPKKASIQ